MRRRDWAITLACVISVAGCSKKSEESKGATGAGESAGRADSPEPNRKVAPIDPVEPAVVLAIWPRQWPALQETAGAVAAMAGAADKNPLAEMPSVWSLLSQVSTSIGPPLSPEPPAGFDDSRALVIEAYPALATFEEVALASRQATGSTQGADLVRWPRFRLRLPATDVKALAQAMDAEAVKLGLRAASSGPVISGDEVAVRFTPTESSLVIDLMAGTGIAAAVTAHADGVFAGLPAADSPSPLDLANPSAARLLLNADPLVELGAITGMLKVAEAVAIIEPAMRDALLFVGTAEVLSIYLFMDPITSLAGVVVVDLPGQGGGGLQVALRLSESAQKALDAGGFKLGSMAPADIKWPAVLDAVQLSPLLQGAQTREAIAEIFWECGWSCYPYLLLGNGVQVAAALHRSGALDANLAALKVQSGPLWDRLTGARLTRSGDLLVIDAGAGQQSVDLVVPDASAVAPAARAAQTCYRKALTSARVSFHEFAEVDPAARQTVLVKSYAALRGASLCDGGDSATAGRYRALADMVGEVAGAPPRP